MAEVATLQTARLRMLAERINAEHSAGEAAVKAALGQMSASLDHAMNAGDLLLEAKAEVGHSNWKPWVRANCEVSVRRAEEYMYIARRRDKIVEESKARHGAFSSIRAALDFLRRTRYTGGGWFQQESELPTPEVEQEPSPAEAARQRAKERAEQRAQQKLNERAAYAIRTGDLEPPADLGANAIEWDFAIQRVVSLREQNMPKIIDILAHQLDILVKQAPPEEVGRYLAKYSGDYDVAEQRAAMRAELREGIAWLQRVLDEAEQAGAAERTRIGGDVMQPGEPSEGAKLLRAMVLAAMAEHDKQSPEDVIGESVSISSPVTDAADIPPDAEYNVRVRTDLQSLAANGYLEPEAAASARAEQISGYDYGIYKVTERGIRSLRAFGMLEEAEQE